MGTGIKRHIVTFFGWMSKNGVFGKLANPSVGPGLTQAPKAAREQETLGLRVDRGEAITLPDGRPGNRFHLQPNAQAKQESIKKLISSKSTHYNIMSFDIPEGADEEEVKNIVANKIKEED